MASELSMIGFCKTDDEALISQLTQWAILIQKGENIFGILGLTNSDKI